MTYKTRMFFGLLIIFMFICSFLDNVRFGHDIMGILAGIGLISIMYWPEPGLMKIIQLEQYIWNKKKEWTIRAESLHLLKNKYKHALVNIVNILHPIEKQNGNVFNIGNAIKVARKALDKEFDYDVRS